MADLKNSKTAENLAHAFAGESQARNKYTYFAEVARRLARARDGANDLRDVEGLHAAVSLDDVLAGEPFTNLHLLLHRIAAREHPTSVG